jgi:hypothetical protein
MKKVRALLAVLLGTAAVVSAAPAVSSATTLPVVFTCSHSPKQCVGAGALGPLRAGYVSSPTETVGVVCVNSLFRTCGLADAVLIVEPGLVGVAAGSEFLNTGVGGFVVATRTVTLTLLETDLFGRSSTVLVEASGGIAGVVVLVPGVRRCLVIVSSKVEAVVC